MKLAIAISGHTREMCEKTYPSLFQHILEKYDCDVFVSTFNRTGNRRFITNEGEKIHKQKEVNIEDIQNIYSPKILLGYDELSPIQIQYNNRFNRFSTTMFKAECCFDMFCKIMTLNRKIEEYSCVYDIKYDYILRIRPDLEVISFNLNEVYDRGIAYLDMAKEEQICDVTFIGDYNTMIRMSHCWTHWEWLIESGQVPNIFNYAEHMFYRFNEYFNILFNIQKHRDEHTFIDYEVHRPYEARWW
jgi:hypothetical protein